MSPTFYIIVGLSSALLAVLQAEYFMCDSSLREHAAAAIVFVAVQSPAIAIAALGHGAMAAVVFLVQLAGYSLLAQLGIIQT